MPRTAAHIPIHAIPIHLRLAALVEEDGRSLAELAKASGLKASGLSQILNGYRPNPTITTIERLLAVLGKTLCDLA